MGHDAAGRVAVRVGLGRAHVTLGVVGIVAVPMGHGGSSDSHLEHVRGLGKAHESHEPAVAPTVDADAVGVGEAVIDEPSNAVHLVADFDVAHVVLDDTLELQAPAGAAPVVEAEHEIAKRAQVLRAHRTGHGPVVVHDLGVGTAVRIDDRWVGAVAELRRGPVQRTVQGFAVARLYADEFRWGESELVYPGIVCRVDGVECRAVLQRSKRYRRWRVRAAERVNESIGGVIEGHDVGAGILGQASNQAAYQWDAVQMALGWPVLRAREVHEPGVLVDSCEGVDGPVAFGKLTHEVAIAVVQIQVSESRPLGCPDEVAVLERSEHIVQIDPYTGCFGQQGHTLSCCRVEPDQVEPGLLAVLKLSAKGAVGHPVDSGEIDVVIVA